jgi:hypothetical protein
MKNLIAIAVLVSLGASAQAKPAPFEIRPLAISANDTVIQSGPAGAMLESDYFRAPQQPVAAGRLLPCRLQLRMFDTIRVASQSCN